MVKSTNFRVTFTCSKKLAAYIKSKGGSAFIRYCIEMEVSYDKELWKNLFCPEVGEYAEK